jgi:transketolase
MMTATRSPYHYVRPEIVERLALDDPFAGVEKQPTRYAYAEAILEVGEQYEHVVVLDADVAKSIKTWNFGEKYPERWFNFGVAEQNMMAAAAGMATTGLIPFASTYAVFASLRALDQVRNSIHYPRLNVKIAASHGGITPGPDGVTHQGQEDLSILRAIANSTVIVPSDSVTTKMAIWAMVDWDGPVYISFTRDPVPLLYTDDYPYEIGKAVVVRDGTDATIVALRDLVAHALVAAERLASRGLSVRVIDCHTLKPLDEDTILQAARETGAIVTAENNVIFGGLGSAVAEVLVENLPVPMERIGVRDTFAESGPYLEIIDKYGLTAPHIANAVRKVVVRKE